MRSTTFRRVLLAGVALPLLMTACGASGGSDAAETTTTTKAKATTTEAKTTTTEAKTTTTGADDAPTKAQLETFIGQVLLTPEETGVAGMVASEPDPPTPAPCGLDIEKEYPAVAQGATVLSADASGLALQESIRVYATEADAKKAYEAVLDTGLGCPESTDGTLKIASQGDASAQIAPPGVDLESEAFTIAADDEQGVVFPIHYSDSLIVFQFANKTGVDTSTAPDTTVIVKTGMAKIDSSIPG